MLQLDKLGKSYQEKKILESLSFGFPTQGVYAIAGPNGIGNSMLFRLIAGVF